jgi:hypothetical protein
VLADISVSDQIVLAIIAAIPGAIAAVGSVIVIVQNVRNRVERQADHAENTLKMDSLTVQINGRLSQLLEAQMDKGRVAEAADQHARDVVKHEHDNPEPHL